ncbi:MAG: hypothetical protein FK733_19275 [Asgard group archaeon]|nr:hypothetical protein [Asgard group archaeon]
MSPCLKKEDFKLKQLNISQVSTFFANGSYPIEFLFYYPYKINNNKLRKALKKISREFWPAFGIYSNGRITKKAFLEDDCYGFSTVDDIFNPNLEQDKLYKKYGSTNPETTQRLFYLKVIQFTNGTVLIPKMNHVAGDGYSYFYLLTVLAAVTKRIGIPLIPTIIKLIFKPKVQNLIADAFHFTKIPQEAISFDENMKVEVLEVKQSEVRNQAKLLSDSSGLRISSNDILCANIVKFIVEKRKETLPNNFKLAIPIDVRRGISELGQRFFGNGLIMYNVPFIRDEVNKLSIEDIALTIRKSFPVRNRESYETFLKKIEEWINSGQLEKLRPYDPDNECLVTNLSRMPISKLDFGSGPPTLIEPLTRGRSGAAILAQNDKFILRFAS